MAVISEVLECDDMKKSSRFAFEPISVSGLLALTIFIGGVVLIPLILLEANNIWSHLDEDMSEFRTMEERIWKEMMSMSDTESKRFRRQFSALFPDIARTDSNSNAHKQNSRESDDEYEYEDGGVYYDDEGYESAKGGLSGQDEYWEEDGPVHRDLISQTFPAQRSGPPSFATQPRPEPQSRQQGARPRQQGRQQGQASQLRPPAPPPQSAFQPQNTKPRPRPFPAQARPVQGAQRPVVAPPSHYFVPATRTRTAPQQPRTPVRPQPQRAQPRPQQSLPFVPSNHAGIPPSDIALAARGIFPPGHPSSANPTQSGRRRPALPPTLPRTASFKASQTQTQARVQQRQPPQEHTIRFSGQGQQIDLGPVSPPRGLEKPIGAEALAAHFNRAPPSIVPLIPQGIVTAFGFGGDIEEEEPLPPGVQISLGGLDRRHGSARASVRAPGRSRLSGASPPAISFGPPRILLPPPLLVLPQPAHVPIPALFPSPAPPFPILPLLGSVSYNPLAGGNLPRGTPPLVSNRELPPELLYLNKFRRGGKFPNPNRSGGIGPPGGTRVLAPGFVSGPPAGFLPPAPAPGHPQLRPPQPTFTEIKLESNIPGSPSAQKLEGPKPVPRTTTTPASVEVVDFPELPDGPHILDLGQPSSDAFSATSNSDAIPASPSSDAIPGSPSSLSASSGAAHKRTQPRFPTQLPKNTLPPSFSQTLADKLGPGARALPPPPRKAGPAGACPAGPRGTTGPRGADGDDGEDGLHGRHGEDSHDVRARIPNVQESCGRCPTGAPGRRGRPGPLGKLGLTGYEGQRGLPGQNGGFGPKGPKGLPGPAGPDGRAGTRGENAPPVYRIQGLPGRQGKAGPRGDAGSRGQEGPPGFRGLRGGGGSIGRHGLTGFPGPEGRGGPRGPKGPLEYCPCPARKPLILGIIQQQLQNRFG